MTQANLEWIQREWRNWVETDRAKKISPSREYKTGVEHVAKLFAAHCMEALASHAPSDSSEICEKCGQEVIDGHWSLVCHKPACIKALQEEDADYLGEAAAQPKRNKQIPEETFSDEIRLGKRKLCGHLAPCDCQNGIYQAEIEHKDH